MDFNFPGEDDPRRQEIRRWFEANPSPSYRKIAERGLSAANWPAPWGLAADAEMSLIGDEEFAHAGVRHPATLNGIAVNQCGQSLLTWGSEAQRQRFLPPALACEEKWCMLFSEPSGGADLGNARTTARREGDHYVVNGQKIWNSLAHVARGSDGGRTFAAELRRRAPDAAIFYVDGTNAGVVSDRVLAAAAGGPL